MLQVIDEAGSKFVSAQTCKKCATIILSNCLQIENCCSGIVAAATEAGRIHLVQTDIDEADRNAQQPPISLTTSAGLARLRIDPTDGGMLASGGRENPLRIWDIETRETIFTAKNASLHTQTVNMQLFLRSAKQIYVYDLRFGFATFVFLTTLHVSFAQRLAITRLADVCKHFFAYSALASPLRYASATAADSRGALVARADFRAGHLPSAAAFACR